MPENLNTPNKDVQLAEELDGMRASLVCLLTEIDKSRFALTQIAKKQHVFNCSDDCQCLRDSVDSLAVACANLSILTSKVFNHE